MLALPSNGSTTTISLTKPAQAIKLKATMMALLAVPKLNAEIVFQIKDVGPKKKPKFSALKNSD